MAEAPKAETPKEIKKRRMAPARAEAKSEIEERLISGAVEERAAQVSTGGFLGPLYDPSEATTPQEQFIGELVNPDEGTPSFTEAGTRVGQGLSRGAVQGGMTAAGAGAGAAIGAELGLLGGPLAPGTVPAGAVIGAVAGGIAGYNASEPVLHGMSLVPLPNGTPLVYDDPSSVPINQRYLAIGGEVFGSIAVPTAAPYILSRAGVRFNDKAAVGSILNSIIRSAEQNPQRFAIDELLMGFGAATGAGTAQAYAPGSGTAQTYGELVGGFLSPARALIGSATWGRHQFNRILQNLPWAAGGATERAASGYLNVLLKKYGSDPEKVMAALTQPDPILDGMSLTAGQKTGNPALLALEGILMSRSDEYGAEARQRAQESLTFLKNSIKLLGEQVGNPVALKQAAEARDKLFRNELQGLVDDAAEKARLALADLRMDDGASRAAFGVKMNEIATESTKLARTAERELWDQVDGTIPRATENTLARIAELQGRTATEAGIELPAPVLALAKTFGETPGTTLERLKLNRTFFLNKSRELAADNKWSEASIYSAVAEAMLDDMVVDLPGEASAAFGAARSFSRQFNEIFGQTFAGDVTRLADEGGFRLSPELVARRAFGAGEELSDLQFRQLAEAAKMAGQEQLSQMLKVQQDTIQFAANRLIGTDGKVNPTKLADWREKHKQLLKRFPEIDIKMRNVEEAQKFLDATQSQRKATERSIKEDIAFSRLIDNEDPATAVGKAITGANPIQELGNMQTFARSAGPDAVAGLESAVFRWMYDKAVDKSGRFSFKVYRQLLEGNVTPSSGSLKDVLTNSGVVDQGRVNQLIAFADRAIQLEDAIASGRQLHELGEDFGMLADFVTRYAGSTIMTYAPGRHSLQAQAAGARLAKQVLDQIPKSKVGLLIEKATKDPAAMALLIEKGGSYRVKEQRARQLNAFLIQAGLIPGWEDEQ